MRRLMKEAVSRSKSSVPPGDPIVRFGNYEVDLRAGELRRGGLKVKLGGQPFDVLVTLLEKPGQVVTREDLHDKLWSQDTFVDFEHGLNKAINKVREALGDDADNPRFIETLPRRGYRFLAPIMTPQQAEIPASCEGKPAPVEIPSSTRAKGLRSRPRNRPSWNPL
jgi:DNA-binding winged helix-turn-helix (wHTH) protein